MMNRLALYLLALAVTASIAKAAPPPKTECSAAEVILKKASGNRCFDKLLVKAKNADDRKWLLGLQKNWNPDPDLKLDQVPGGLVLYKKEKLVLDARFIFGKPPVLAVNGKIFVYRGEPKSRSVKKFVDELLDQKPARNAFLEMLLPDAVAQGPASGNAGTVFTLYTLNSGEAVDTSSIISELKGSAGVFPRLGMVQRAWSGRDLKCDANGGLESVAYDLNQDNAIRNSFAGAPRSRKVAVHALSGDAVEIKGMFGKNGEKTVIAEHVPIQEDRSYKIKLINAQTTSCAGDRFKFYVCNTDECTSKTPIANENKLAELARDHYKKDVCTLTKALVGTTILANCCKTESCREIAQEKLSINLETDDDDDDPKSSK